MVAVSASHANDVLDLLVADVAIRVQLSPSNHELAIERLETLERWLARDDSELAGRVRRVYPQGSMALHATIASKLRNDEFDVDAIVELDLPPGATPQQALDLLYRSVKGRPGSRYFEATTRNTRCVTVAYAQMHVDLTPAELLPWRVPRTSYIFHHRVEDRDDGPGKRVIANPFGFAEWFKQVTPRAASFERFFEERSRKMDTRYRALKVEETPKPLPAYLKPPAVISHQLIKRYRNVRYDRREGRRPPSVMLACLAAHYAGNSGRPFSELLYQARALVTFFTADHERGARVEVVNPVCPEDKFTDRWPGTLAEQKIFVDDLRLLVSELESLERGASLERIEAVFGRLFGEDISRTVIREFADRTGRTIANGELHTGAGGHIDLGRSGVIAAVPTIISTPSRAAPRHTFYGTEDR